MTAAGWMLPLVALVVELVVVLLVVVPPLHWAYSVTFRAGILVLAKSQPLPLPSAAVFQPSKV